ncbi:MAG: type II secretion system F family protein [Raoultibacter sp.]
MGASLILVIVLACGCGVLAFYGLKKLWAPAPEFDEYGVELQQKPVERLQILADKIARRFGALLPVSEKDAMLLRAKLQQAGVGISPASWYSFSVVFLFFCILVAVIASFLFTSDPVKRVVIGLSFIILGAWLPNFILIRKTKARRARMSKELPDVIDMITAIVGGGLSFSSAIRHVAEKFDGVLASELRLVCKETEEFGSTHVAALRRMAKRCEVDELTAFISAAVQADERGTMLVDTCRAQAKAMRHHRRQQAVEQAQKLPNKLIFPQVFLLLPVEFIIMLAPPLKNLITSYMGV